MKIVGGIALRDYFCLRLCCEGSGNNVIMSNIINFFVLFAETEDEESESASEKEAEEEKYVSIAHFIFQVFTSSSHRFSNTK